ncbi:hypothetical protein D6V39_02645 [Vibrio cholerae]|nr:hypothetical protein [Vibrio cholerae]MVB41306.1 hypothetical protein [Vibrio cholerae]MVB50322.1 hypothetical protein [Vibrio cholerae]
MKISDFFSNLPWRTDGNVSFLYLTPEQNRAIAIAVNNHDRLTEENNRLRDALEKIQRMQSRTPELPEDYTHEDVGDLNDRIDEVFGIVNTALSELGGE